MKQHFRLIDYFSEVAGISRDDIITKLEKHITIQAEVVKVLQNTIVVPEKDDLDLSHHIKGISGSDSYIEFIDTVIIYVSSKKIKNCICDGYEDPAKKLSYSADYFNPYGSFKVNVLKNKLWQCIYNIVGKDKFLVLLLGTRVYIRGGNGTYIQLCGNEIPYSFKNFDSSLSQFVPNFDILPESVQELMIEILGDEGMVVSNLPKKYNGFQDVCYKVYSNHEKCNYGQILSNLKSKIDNSMLDPTTVIKSDVGIVVKFTLIIMGKIFGGFVWGNKRNKSVISKMTINYVKYGVRAIPSDINLRSLKSFSLKAVEWVGTQSRIANVQDLNMRSSLIIKFISWYLCTFLKRLVCKFWKRIPRNAPGGKFYMEYYPIEQWSIRSKRWLKEYTDSFLYPSNGELTKSSDCENNFVGSTKLIPKAEGFRLLCIPLRSRPLAMNQQEEEIRYNVHLRNFVKPLQYLIMTKDRELSKSRTFSHPRSFSIQDVAKHIKNFKGQLSKCGRMDKFYILKFDMKHCYDNMDQDRMLSCIEKLFENDEDNKTYFVRRYRERFMYSDERDKSKFIVNDLENLDLFNVDKWDEDTKIQLGNDNKALVDKCVTAKFKKKEVIDAVDDYIRNSAIIVGNSSLKLYKRRKGVFQGFPLSATLCNIFYNQLIDEELNFTFQEANQISTLIRLVDDFLFISTSQENCQKVYSKVSSDEFKAIGAILSEKKTSWIEGGLSLRINVPGQDDEIKDEESQLSFVGLSIDRATLATKPLDISDPTRLVLERCNNFKELYSFLLWWYKAQLKPNLISLEYAPFEQQHGNLKGVWRALIDSFTSLTDHFIKNGHSVSIHNHSLFILGILEATLNKWNYTNKQKYNTQICNSLTKLLTDQATIDKHIEQVCYILHYL
ncbi:hypothetical protein PSN45_004870 [Yamadazyma tenuis]|uniref:uncharacterized protein n=1 Tax=Candida tenuis TaxID=2315449 RepID=UPI00279FE8E2|nr:hypothetical protein PSN45_004870 [Yamadazyma tenuis]